MFDKLIESEPEGADIRDRRSYFMVSSAVVGIVFLTAVVISIYAADYALGRDSFEMSMIVAPPEIASPEPQIQQRRPSTNQAQSNIVSPQKPAIVSPVDETRSIPTGTSTVPHSLRTWGDPLSDPNSDNTISDTNGRDTPGSGTEPSGIVTKIEPTEPDPIPEPPPIKRPDESKQPVVIRSEGVINGKATYLPKPLYPATATALNLQGKVDVQVMIDETGKVVSAKAVSGHSFFKPVAERSAWQAKFSPTYLGKTPVKVMGVIVYNFSR